jgi:Tol biopolymer transport system component
MGKSQNNQQMNFMKTICTFAMSLFALSATGVSLQLHSQIDSSFAPSASAGGDSTLPVMSPDARFVLFASTGNNLALAATNTPYHSPIYRCYNVYLRDRASNTTVLVSVSLDGITGADRDAMPAGISTNGQFALFESTADNLAAGATNTVSKVFVRDLVNGTNFLVSVNTNGLNGNGNAYSSVITPDGRYVAFASAASDLVTNDANGIPDIFVRDLQSGTTICATPGARTTGSTTLLSASDAPVLTPDGRYLAFYSSATNLVPGQKVAGEVYVRDWLGGTTTWASSQARSQFLSVVGTTNAVSCNPCISDDGNYIAFAACTNAPTAYSCRGIVLRYNRTSGQTDLVDTNSFVPITTFDSIQELNMTPDGRFIASVANLPGNAGANTAIYLWDAQSGASTLVSADTNNTLPATGFCDSPYVSANGRYVAFLSTIASLATNAAGSNPHVYLRDTVAGNTGLVNADTNDNSAAYVSVLGLCLSADGQSVAYDSTQAGLLANDRNGDCDVFLYNAASGATEFISAPHPALPSFTSDGYSTFSAEPLSRDGHYLAFASDADDLVPGDTNKLRDVFVRDLYQGTTTLVSVGLNGAGACGMSYDRPSAAMAVTWLLPAWPPISCLALVMPRTTFSCATCKPTRQRWSA